MAIRESAYRTLERVAQIKNVQERTDAIRRLCQENKVLTLVLQYTYHPDVKFDLPEGELPDNIVKYSKHDDFSAFYSNVKKLKNFSVDSPVSRKRKEINFAVLCETVCAADVPLLIGIKDKKLPWRTLNEDFCMKALPELYPAKEKVDDE